MAPERSPRDGAATVGAGVGDLLVVVVVIVVRRRSPRGDVLDDGLGELGVEVDLDLLEVADLGRAVELDVAFEVGGLAVEPAGSTGFLAGAPFFFAEACPAGTAASWSRSCRARPTACRNGVRVRDSSPSRSDGSMRVAESAAATRPSRYGALCGAPGRVG